jgi:hypothetical protein
MHRAYGFAGAAEAPDAPVAGCAASLLVGAAELAAAADDMLASVEGVEVGEVDILGGFTAP